jgi:hypothetical protein
VLGEHGQTRETLFLIANATQETARLTFTFRDAEGRTVAGQRRTVSAGGQLRIGTAQLLDRVRTWDGLVSIDSSAPVVVAALATTRNSRGEQVISAAHIVDNAAPQVNPASVVVPKILNGAGYRTHIMLVNPSDQPMQGRIQFFAPSGEVSGLPPVTYTVPPQGIYSYQTDGMRSLAKNAYAVVTPTDSNTPNVAALTRLSDGETFISEMRIDASGPVQQAWIPVNTHPTPVRHGEIQARITVVNNNPVGAGVRFTLYASDGKDAGRYELIIPERQQRDFSLVQLFNIGQFKGTIHIFSDAPVSIHAEQKTINIRGEAISMQMPVFGPGAVRQVVPHLVDGRGYSTELVLVNTGNAPAAGQLSILTPNGEPLSLPLR